MSRPISVDVFVEDEAHERLLLALVRRLAVMVGRGVNCAVLRARGGHAKAVGEMELVQRGLLRGGVQRVHADIFLVGIDGNCTTSHEKSKEIARRCLPEFRDRLVIACPDPHIEKWYMADPAAFHHVVGAAPAMGRDKCKRDYYKQLLTSTVAQAGSLAPLGGIEFADEIGQSMDLYRAGKLDPALGHFLKEMQSALGRVV